MSSRNYAESDSLSSHRVETILRGLAGCDHAAFCTARSSLSWTAWREEVLRLRKLLHPLSLSPVGLVFPPGALSYASLCALSSLDCHVHLLDASLDTDEIGEIGRRHHLAALVCPVSDELTADVRVRRLDHELAGSGRGGVTIFTSGSTGAPKAVNHDWETLTRPVRLASSARSQTWMLTYRPQLYAGLQVFLHCLLNRGTLVIPDPQMAARDLIGLMRRHQVRYISATPSYWRRLIALGSGAELGALGIEQITLGGEISDQALLDALARTFPDARVVHIYATSELGRCFSVKDGRAGFPASYLEGETEEGVALKLDDGELHVRSANSMRTNSESETLEGRNNPWIATGDLVERVDDRCFFKGRRTELLNVGGNKVHPHRVEQVVQAVAGVADVRIYGKTSSLVGQMVACEFVVAAGFQPEAVKQEIIRECRERLAAHERPRFLEIVDEIALSDAGKKLRLSDPGAAP